MDKNLRNQLLTLEIINYTYNDHNFYLEDAFRQENGVKITLRALLIFAQKRNLEAAQIFYKHIKALGEEALDIPVIDLTRRLGNANDHDGHMVRRVLREIIDPDSVVSAVGILFRLQPFASNPLYSYMREWLAQDIHRNTGCPISIARMIRPQFHRGEFEITWDRVAEPQELHDILMKYKAHIMNTHEYTAKEIFQHENYITSSIFFIMLPFGGVVLEWNNDLPNPFSMDNEIIDIHSNRYEDELPF